MQYKFVTALAVGAAAGVIDPRRSSNQARDALSLDSPFRRSQENLHPCKVLADAYTAADPEPGRPVYVTVPPSVGIACLKSVPTDTKRNKALLEYLLPFVSFHSTIEILADPPEDYLVPGVDILGGWENITAKLGQDLYENQYEFMIELQSIFVAAADNHFHYSPALLNTLAFTRPELDLTSLSFDGIKLPQIFMRSDLIHGNHHEMGYSPSAIESIDGVPVVEFLEQVAALSPANFQDPDAQYNRLFSSIAGRAVSRPPSTNQAHFEIPDNHTIVFYNGSEKVVANRIAFPPTVNFTGIDSGEVFHRVFEVPTAPRTKSEEPKSNGTTKTESKPSTTATASATATSIPDYPKPIAKLPQNSIAGYFLNGTDYEDVVVISILSFLPLKYDIGGIGSDIIGFIGDAQKMLVKIIKEAKADGRDKLVIDISANSGGSKPLAMLLYTTLFPGAKLDVLDRYRSNEALEATSAANFSLLNQMLIFGDRDLLDSDGKTITSGPTWFGPYTVANQNVSEAFQPNNSVPLSTDPDLYYNGYDPSGKTVFSEPPFKPENIVIVTDGTCASACTIFTGFLTRQQGVRTVALGGRPQKQAMQAMGGTKGTLLTLNSVLAANFQNYVKYSEDDAKTLKILEDAEQSFPSIETPPLLPIFAGSSGGAVNAVNGYTADRLDDYPVQFRYEAANCRLFYTQRMTADVAEVWRRAAAVAWGNGTCVEGSTTGHDGRIGDKTVEFSPKVKSRATGYQGPGSL